MMISLYSLLENRDTRRRYDITVMHKELTDRSIQGILQLGKLGEGIRIHIMDVGSYDEQVKDGTSGYITSETNYRLFLLGELFAQYDRMLYVDCDTIVLGNVAELFDTDLHGNALGAVEAYDHRLLSATKKARFFEGKPYNIDDYKTKILGLTGKNRYFNAGVLLFDLDKSRSISDSAKAIRLLNHRHYCYNDQDVLNMLFQDSVELLDVRWNYTTDLIECAKLASETVARLYEGTQLEDYKLIHYVSGRKPWMAETPLDGHFHNYEKKLQEYSRRNENA